MKTYAITITGYHNMVSGYHNAVPELAGIELPGVAFSEAVSRGAHNVYYVKYAGFVVKFMRTSLSGTYRRISRLLKFSCGFTITS